MHIIDYNCMYTIVYTYLSIYQKSQAELLISVISPFFASVGDAIPRRRCPAAVLARRDCGQKLRCSFWHFGSGSMGFAWGQHENCWGFEAEWVELALSELENLCLSAANTSTHGGLLITTLDFQTAVTAGSWLVGVHFLLHPNLAHKIPG